MDCLTYNVKFDKEKDIHYLFFKIEIYEYLFFVYAYDEINALEEVAAYILKIGKNDLLINFDAYNSMRNKSKDKYIQVDCCAQIDTTKNSEWIYFIEKYYLKIEQIL